MNRRLTFLITSGPTREYIDPVRYISNESSGKMGAALCEAALKRGHKVIFVSGKTAHCPKGKAEIIDIVSADNMFKAVKKNFKRADIIIGAAAVSDFKPVKFSENKIKKKNILTLKLKQNPDILAYCGKNKKKQVVAGFALETDGLIKNAEKKLKAKNLDLIIANGKQSLGADKSSVFIISKRRISCEDTAVAKRRRCCGKDAPRASIKTTELLPKTFYDSASSKTRHAFAANKIIIGKRDCHFCQNIAASKKIIAEKIINETISIFANIKTSKKFA